jgi:hypothetical protein
MNVRGGLWYLDSGVGDPRTRFDEFTTRIEYSHECGHNSALRDVQSGGFEVKDP